MVTLISGPNREIPPGLAFGAQGVDSFYSSDELVWSDFRDGSLILRNDRLSLDAGSTTNLGLRLGTRPRSDVIVTPSLITSNPSPNSQTISLPNSWYGTLGTSHRWRVPGTRPQINDILTPDGEDRYFSEVSINSYGRLYLSLDESASGSDQAQNNLSDLFSMGGIVITFAGTTYSFNLDRADVSDPYHWTPDNDTDALALYNAIGSATNFDATLTIHDFDPPALVSVDSAELRFTDQNWHEYQDLEVSAAGIWQSFIMPAETYFFSQQPMLKGWTASPAPAFIDAFRPRIILPRHFRSLRVYNSGRVEIHVDSGPVQSGFLNNDLSPAFEHYGSVSVIADGMTLTAALDGAATSEPYNFTPSNSADVTAMYNALSTIDGSTPSTIIFRDFNPVDSTINLTASGPFEFEGKTASAVVSVN